MSGDNRADNHSRSATQAGAGPDRPTANGDPQELQQEIERTRERLGDTVQQLAAKADVKAMARDKASELSERVKDKTGQVRVQAATRAEGIKTQLAGKTTAARHRAQSVSEGRIAQVREQVAAVGTPVREKTPKQVRDLAAKGVAGARRRQVPLAAAAGALGALVLGLLLVRLRRGRRSTGR
jgi:uncharacterized protein DUF3618